MAFVLKRLADAERDGDRIYSVIRGIGVAGDAVTAHSRATIEARGDFKDAIAFDATADVGQAGAGDCGGIAREGLPVASARDPAGRFTTVLAARSRNRPSASDRERQRIGWDTYRHPPGRTRAEYDRPDPDGRREQPLGARAEAVFVVEGSSHHELIAELVRLRSFAIERTAWNIEATARKWWSDSRQPAPRQLAVSLVAPISGGTGRTSGLRDRESPAPAADSHFPPVAKPALRDRVFSPQPLGPNARLAFVFPGSGNQFNGMGRDLSAQWPDLLRRQETESELLRGQFAPDSFWHGNADEALPRDLMFGQVAVGALVADLALSLGVKPCAMIGLSLGESAGLFGTRIWRDRDAMFRRMRNARRCSTPISHRLTMRPVPTGACVRMNPLTG